MRRKSGKGEARAPEEEEVRGEDEKGKGKMRGGLIRKEKRNLS